MTKDYFEKVKKLVEEKPERKKDRLISTNIDAIIHILIEQKIVSEEQYEKILNKKELEYDQLMDEEIKKAIKDFENSGTNNFFDYLFESIIKSK